MVEACRRPWVWAQLKLVAAQLFLLGMELREVVVASLQAVEAVPSHSRRVQLSFAVLAVEWPLALEIELPRALEQPQAWSVRERFLVSPGRGREQSS